MIVNLIPHGRTRRDVVNLDRHLADETGQQVRVLRIVGTVFDDPCEAFFDLVRLRGGSKASVGLWHVPISPAGIPIPDGGDLRGWTEAERDRVVARILEEMGASAHGYVLIEHAGKMRVDDAAPSSHYHLVVAHVGRDFRALDSSYLLLRLERIAAELRFDLGERAVATRHHTVLAHLREAKRIDVAEAIEEVQLPGEVNSAMSAKARAVAARHGIDLAKVRGRIMTAWSASDDRAEFERALAEMGLDLVPSTKRPNHWVIATDDVVLGQLHRLLKLDPTIIASWIASHDAKPVVEEVELEFPGASAAVEGSSVRDAFPVSRVASAATSIEAGSRMPPVKAFDSAPSLSRSWTAPVETVQRNESSAPAARCTYEGEAEIREQERSRLMALLDDAKVRHATALAPPPPPRRLIEADRALAQAKLRRTKAWKMLEQTERESSDAKALIPPLLARVLPRRRRQRQEDLGAWDAAVEEAGTARWRAEGDVERAKHAAKLALNAYQQAIAESRPDREARAEAIHNEIERLTKRIERLDRSQPEDPHAYRAASNRHARPTSILSGAT